MGVVVVVGVVMFLFYVLIYWDRNWLVCVGLMGSSKLKGELKSN